MWPFLSFPAALNSHQRESVTQQIIRRATEGADELLRSEPILLRLGRSGLPSHHGHRLGFVDNRSAPTVEANQQHDRLRGLLFALGAGAIFFSAGLKAIWYDSCDKIRRCTYHRCNALQSE
jgi:hypothetical protein